MGGKGSRDQIAELLEKRSRLLRSNRYNLFRRRHYHLELGVALLIDQLDDAVQDERDAVREMLKYAPIGMVACWEGYLRLLVADLINHGSPFRENAAKLDLGKFDAAAVLAVSGKKVTVGELIAHQLRINNLDDINRILSTVMGCDFLHELRFARHPRDETPLFQVDDDVIRMVSDIFELRHIFCHELAVKTSISVRDADDGAMMSSIFVYYTEVLSHNLLGKNGPPIL